MGSLGDVYELVDDQRQDGQVIQNRWMYRLDTPVVGNAAEFLSDTWITNVLPKIVAFQDNALTHVGVIVKNLFNDTEEHTELVSVAGTAADSVLPPFNAVGFRQIGNNASINDGAKRFGGINEGAMSEGVITNTATITALTALAVQMALGLPVGLDADAFIPVIVGSILDGTSYRLPENAGEATLSEIIGALFNIDVTSQTSRKKGRGV